MKKLVLIVFAIVTTHCYAQINFEKGYYITNSNQRIECFIKNVDWRSNPTSFQYKQTQNSGIRSGNILTIKEFGIYDSSKFIRSKVFIDRSDEYVNHMSKEKRAILKEETLFLKVLIEGKASLYFYQDNNLKRFFYSVDNADIKQLIYKVYEISITAMGKNERYKQQLLKELQCDQITKKSIQQLSYKHKQLTNFFTKYNTCVHSDYSSWVEKTKRELAINFKIKSGVRLATLQFRPHPKRIIDFDSQLGISLGIETEVVLPFNQGKWSFFFDPTFQYYNVKGHRNIPYPPSLAHLNKIETKYSSIELPLGIRHYFFLNENSKLFINAALVFDFVLGNSQIIRPRSSFNLNIDSDHNFAFGIGYVFNKKYGLEARYNTGRDITSKYVFFTSSFESVGLVFSYQLF